MRRQMRGITTEGVSRAMLVGLTGNLPEQAEESMEELGELSRTAGMEVASIYLQTRIKPDPRTIIGKGKLQEITIDALDQAVETLIFDRELSPSQLRAVTDETERPHHAHP
jgi:GTP-binding protein HflX